MWTLVQLEGRGHSRLKILDTLKVKSQSRARVSFELLEVGQRIAKGFPPMNELCETADFSERQIYDRTKTLFGHFQWPFDIPPPG